MTDIRLLETRNGTFRVALDGATEAPALMFSNSLGTPLEMWDTQAKRFASTHRVVRYDTRGHGQSAVTPGPYSFDQLGDDVLAILDALKIGTTVFCGLSMGGHTALWLGVNASARLNGLVVCNSAARIGAPSGWQERAATVRAGGTATMQELATTAPQRWFTPNFIARHPQAVQRAQRWIEQTDSDGYAACCDALSQSDLRQAIQTIAVPTLLIAGADDPVTTVADAEAMRTAIAGAQLAQVPASHLSNLEAPEAVDAALERFLKSIPSR
jgi:3-oxoadipate enol-lactonase